MGSIFRFPRYLLLDLDVARYRADVDFTAGSHPARRLPRSTWMARHATRLAARTTSIGPANRASRVKPCVCWA